MAKIKYLYPTSIPCSKRKDTGRPRVKQVLLRKSARVFSFGTGFNFHYNTSPLFDAGGGLAIFLQCKLGT